MVDFTSLASNHPSPPRESSARRLRGAGAALGGVAGLLLGAGLGVVGAIRRNRPVHAVGTVVPGTLAIDTPGATGSALFDTAGTTALAARLSRAASWPVQLPDVNGVALRVPGGGPDGVPADLLFASSGTGPLTRYLLQLHTSAAAGPLTTMFPLAGPEGNIVFRLDPGPHHHYRLSYSRNSGSWQTVGRVAIEPPPGPVRRSSPPASADDPRLRFRPVAHPPTGLTVPAWLRAARAPAYGIARFVWRA